MVARRRVATRSTTRRRRSSPTCKNNAEGLIYTTEKSLEEYASALKPEDLDEIRADLEALQGGPGGRRPGRHQGGAGPPRGQRLPDRRRHLRPAGRHHAEAQPAACQAAFRRYIPPGRSRPAASRPDPVEKRDYYEVLGVGRDADAGGAQERLPQARPPVPPRQEPGRQGGRGEVQGAHRGLRGPLRRRQAGPLRPLRPRRRRRRRPTTPSASACGGASINDIFGDIFGEMFGGGGGRRGPRSRARGADFRYHLELTLEEAAFGVDEAAATSPRPKPLRALPAAAAPSPAPRRRTCPTCGGTGEVRLTQGFFSIARTCHHCQGAGRVIAEKCPACGGAGATRERGRRRGEDPARRRHRHPGPLAAATASRPPAPGGQPGDLYVVIQVQGAPALPARGDRDRLRGADLLHPGGARGHHRGADARRPAQAQAPARHPDRRDLQAARARACRRCNGSGRGDQHVRVVVETPTHLDPRAARAAGEVRRALRRGDTHPRGHSFWEKAAELWRDSKKKR